MRYLGPWKAGNVADLDVGIVGSFQISLLALHVVGRFADGDGGGNGGGEDERVEARGGERERRAWEGARATRRRR